MKNSGVFQILKKGDIYKIVYIEKGEIYLVYPNEFTRYEEANDYKKTHKEELDQIVTNKKIAEQKRKEKEEEERKAKEAAEKAKEEEKNKKKEEKRKKKEERKEKVKAVWANAWVKFVSGFLVAVMLLTGGHFAGKGISNAIKNRDSKKPTTSQTGQVNPTEPTISVSNDVENIVKYEEIYSTENFEKMVAVFVKPYVDNKVSLTTEDLLKFTSIVNIDRLVEENPEFAKELFGSQTAEEYLNDAAKTIGVTYMYNHTMWEKDKNTNNFIWISNSIPEGDPQKEKMVELEGYVTKIANASAEKNEEEVNRLTLELIESLTLPTGSLNALDDGVEFGAQLYFALINNSIARNYLNKEYRDYFDTRSSAEQNVSNIFTVYNKCITDGKVRTRSN